MILFFYTALKHRGYNYLFCFNSSAISTNGKIKMQRIINICLPPILLHCSQTVLLLCVVTCLFDDPFLLHCSQTSRYISDKRSCLMILFFYTALKQVCCCCIVLHRLMILFFYTALKRARLEECGNVV